MNVSNAKANSSLEVVADVVIKAYKIALIVINNIPALNVNGIII